MSDNLHLAPFNDGAPLILSKAGNGGWIISQQFSRETVSETLGAFTDTTDMLDALAFALIPEAPT